MLWSESFRRCNGCPVVMWPSGGERMCEDLVWESRSIWRRSTLGSLGHVDGGFEWKGLYIYLDSQCDAAIFLDLSGSLCDLRSLFFSDLLGAFLCEVIDWRLGVVVAGFPKRQGFADHVLQVDTGKRENAVYWNLQEPHGRSLMWFFSEHSLGTLSCSSIRRRNTNSCLVGGRCVVFHCLASWQCWRESDLETLWKWNVALALKGWVCPDFHWRNRWPNSKWVGRIVGRCFFHFQGLFFF